MEHEEIKTQAPAPSHTEVSLSPAKDEQFGCQLKANKATGRFGGGGIERSRLKHSQTTRSDPAGFVKQRQSTGQRSLPGCSKADDTQPALHFHLDPQGLTRHCSRCGHPHSSSRHQKQGEGTPNRVSSGIPPIGKVTFRGIPSPAG